MALEVLEATMEQSSLDLRIKDLLSQPSSSSRTLDLDSQLLQSLQASLSALAPLSSPSHHSQDPLSPIPSSLWREFQDYLKQSSVTEFHHHHAEDNVKAGAVSESPAAILQSHLESVYATEPAIAKGIRSTVTQALASSHSDEEVSIELAEVLGFDQLELVTSLLGDRSNSLLQLRQYGDQASQAHSQTGAVAQPMLAAKPPVAPPAQESVGQVRISAKPYIPGSQVVVQTQEDIATAKRVKAEHRRAMRSKAQELPDERAYTAEELQQIREESLEAAANRPLFSGTVTSSSEPKYPHVFSSGTHGNTLSVFGNKFSLPVGTTREEQQFYEEITIPPPKTVPFRLNERLVPISEMDTICKGAFPGYSSLNRLQSVVYPLAYKSNENLLICAPTGAGKTDVAMLTVLRAISQYAKNIEPVRARGLDSFGISRNDFKIVYVAPMKALAAEVVRKFSKRLQYLGIKVRELTGDMQLTRQEIADTQIIVTTPEKWDVVTRKPSGEGELATKVKLLIIDEVHLLHEDRGAVIETIVARTLRLVESSQSLIRIVGLSATLPNYVDVADFLRVNRYQGLFYFDSSFRPVPLEQHFLGVKGKAGSPQSRANLDKAAFEKVSELVQAGHQVMVFVHARKETVKTAQTLREMFKDEGIGASMLEGREDHPRFSFFKKELSSSRNREMRELFEGGFGIHHAGMLRSDRNLSERMFEAGVTRVLCCTATLAWGVNLPAYAVVIKGTEVYDSAAGKFVDLSILDVLQIFGRAGRPQYEDLGVGYILTSNDKLSHYVDAITSQHPIESKFITGLIDSLNAEVALGTVSNIRDGVSWLGYTYLFTRMKRTPFTYGMPHSEVEDDPHLGGKRLQLITSGAKKLVEAKMLTFDEATGHMAVTPMGRVAAKYYIGYRTIEIFNEKLRPSMTEADVLGLLSLGTDFEQIIPRDSEEKELKKMLENAPCEVPGGVETSPGKVNILLQAYISRTYVEDFALVSDSAYVAQNASRIIRCLLEIALNRKWAPTTAALMSMSKAIERRMWPFDHPLSQTSLSPDTIYNLTRWADEVEISELARMPATEIGDMIHLNEKIGGAVKSAARQFPSLTIETSLRPITHELLRINVKVSRDFEWSERLHGRSEPFYVWIEDENEIDILQWTFFNLRPSDASSDSSELSFTIQVPKELPAGVSVRWISDRWIGSENSVWVPFDDLIMPPLPPNHLALLDLPLLPVSSAIRDPVLEAIYSSEMSAFNALQTQVFHTLMHTKANSLVCAPMCSGKSTVVHMAIWRAFQECPSKAVLILHPRRDISHQEYLSFSRRFGHRAQVNAVSLSTNRDSVKQLREPQPRTVVFGAPATVGKWMSLSASSPLLKLGSKILEQVSLVILEDLHLLDPTYELVSARLLREASLAEQEIRFVATSSSLQDATSLGGWLGVKDSALYSFHPKDRPSSLTSAIQSFDLPHSLGLLKSMVKPAYDKMREVSTKGPAILFVPSRHQCLSTAYDLVTRMASELDTEVFVGLPSQDLEAILEGNVQDANLVEPLLHGVGVLHESMSEGDQALVLRLYDQGLIKVLVAPREICWSLGARAYLVVVMGTQFVRMLPTHNKSGITDKVLVDYPLSDVARMMSLAVRRGAAKGDEPMLAGESLILCQGEKAEFLNKMLIGSGSGSGLPLESSLLEDGGRVFLPLLLDELVREGVRSKEEAVGIMSWTLLIQRIRANPSYYEAFGEGEDAVSVRISEVVDHLFDQLLKLKAIRTKLGRQPSATTVTTTTTISEPLEPIMLYEATELGRSLNLRPGSTLLHIVTWFENQTMRPLSAAKVASDYAPYDRVGGEGVAKSGESEVLEATRSIIPSEWLEAFKVPRPGPDRCPIPSKTESGFKVEAETAREDPEDQKAAVSHEDQCQGLRAELAGGARQEASSVKGRLLMACLFSCRPLVTRFEAEALKGNKGRRRRKKEEEEEKEEIVEEGVGGGGQEESREQDRAREALEAEQMRLLIGLLENITSLGGRSSRDGGGKVRR
ncbi:Sec63-domain-containing protein [Violaceomyces palustris]|uniref:Sec63-domain-containing protein n=1 Tax=Violaceomyces palustris TaxID=1673888 RepID=A0ACD0P7X6_9BASI|nr:Sec63-domain-containing protein [Violaceomyces palustris]